MRIRSEDFSELWNRVPHLSCRTKHWVYRVGAEFGHLDESAWLHTEDPVARVVRLTQGDNGRRFESRVREMAVRGGICVVGNSASLRGRALGEAIDAFGMVVRFNFFEGSSASDLGKKLCVWVGSPSFRGEVPKPREAVIISGPEMDWVLRDWTKYRGAHQGGIPVLSVPRSVWRDCVEILGAPPSSGFLILFWIRRILGGWQGVAIAGIGAQGSTYHLAGPHHAPTAVHDFHAEAQLVDSWECEGLKRL